jgi:hypothetical protein
LFKKFYVAKTTEGQLKLVADSLESIKVIGLIASGQYVKII